MNILISLVVLAIALLPGPNLAPQLAGGINQLVSLPHPAPTSLQSSYQPLAIPIATTPTSAPPQLSAASWYAIDATSGVTLAAHDADSQRPIASITKLATALVIVRDHSLSQQIAVPQLPTYQPGDEIIGLQPGERFSYHDLLAALLINSADDSADALAIADGGSAAAFAVKMNQTLARWGITGAHFSNPSGLIDNGNSASARAVAQIGLLALQNTTIKQLVDTQTATITDRAGRQIALTTTNQLLQNGQFQGIKTGYTGAAGQCFIGLTKVQGHPVVTVVLGSQDRFGDTTGLINWINQNYQWQAP